MIVSLWSYRQLWGSDPRSRPSIVSGQVRLTSTRYWSVHVIVIELRVPFTESRDDSSLFQHHACLWLSVHIHHVLLSLLELMTLELWSLDVCRHASTKQRHKPAFISHIVLVGDSTGRNWSEGSGCDNDWHTLCIKSSCHKLQIYQNVNWHRNDVWGKENRVNPQYYLTLTECLCFFSGLYIWCDLK